VRRARGRPGRAARRLKAGCCSTLLLLAGCGYVGPVLPPSPDIPSQVVDLSAVERGDKIVISFHTPNDPIDPQPIAMTESIPLDGLPGKRLAIAVRTSIKRGNHTSSWSNRVVLNVVPPLGPPANLGLEASAEGVMLDWQPVDSAKAYLILRQAPIDKTLVEIARAQQPHYLDTTAQFAVPYSYEVIALNGSAESPPSEVKQITPVDKFAPSVPARVTALAGPESIELSWQRSPEADLAGYYVYRSVNGGPFERQGELVNLPAFSDRTVEHGKTYRYQISSVDKANNESARSAVTQITF
jgi:hypothetical protein